MLSPKLLTHRWICVVPVAFLAVFVGLYVIAQTSVLECKTKSLVDCKAIYIYDVVPATGVEDAAPALQVIQDRYTGRMIWVFLALTYILVCVSSLLVLALIVKKWRDGSWAVAVIVLSILGGAITSCVDHMPIAAPLFEQTVMNKWGGISNFLSLIKMIAAVSYGTTLAMALTVASILHVPATDQTASQGDDPRPEDQAELSAKSKDLTTVLYASTILLVVGIFLWSQNFNWAATFVDTALTVEDTNNVVAAQIKAFYSSVIGALGGFFTLVLAAVYLPAAYIIHERAKLAVSERATEGDASSGVSLPGFTFSFTQSLPQILAIAAPLLSGPIAQLFQNIK